MKKFSNIMLAASLLSVGLVSASSAATVDVYITGSSAYRGAVTNAIGHLLTNPMAAFVGTTGTGALSKANQQYITGTPNSTGTTRGLTAGNTYNFHTSYSGSVAGISVLVFNINTAAPFIANTPALAAMTVGSGANSNSGADGGVGGATAAQVGKADGAFSDVFQTSTIYTSTTLVGAGGSGLTYGSGVIGVVPFTIVANPDLANFVGASGKPITNASATQLKSLFFLTQDLAQFTGNDADQGQVLPVGRNFDSGTRLTTFAETSFNPVGALQNEPTQYAVSTSGSSVVVSLYPAETLFSGTPASATFTSGQSGYASGGNEATALSISGTSGANSTNPSYLIGYLGESDANTVVKAGGNYLSYNGVAYGSFTTTVSGTTTTRTTAYNRTLIDEGLYTLWGYEHLYYRSGNGNVAALDAVAQEVAFVDAPIAGEIISNMAVQRPYEGGPISYVGPGGTSGL